MNKEKTIEVLKNFQQYRRGGLKFCDFTPYQIGEAIESAIEIIDLTMQFAGGKDKKYKNAKF